MHHIRPFYYLLLLCLMPVISLAQTTSDDKFTVTVIADGLGVPWGMAMLSDDTMLVTDRSGSLSKLNLTTNSKTNIAGLPEDMFILGQGGLLDVALPPDYQQTGWIYFSYSKNVDDEGATTLARAELLNDQLVDWQDLLVTNSRSHRSVHFAGRISFDDQGHVFLSIGDRGVRPNAQDRSNHAGSIIRLNLDGSVPADNPFVNDAKALDEIWSYGHRNPQGLFFNTKTQQLWSSEHGPRGGDEINLINSGNNYGWPVISYGKEYFSPFAVGEDTHKAGMEQPIKVYTPSIAPGNLIQYQSDTFAHWQGNLFLGALKLQHLNMVTLTNGKQAAGEKRLLSDLAERIRNVIESPQGWLYLSTDSGKLLRLSPSSE